MNQHIWKEIGSDEVATPYITSDPVSSNTHYQVLHTDSHDIYSNNECFPDKSPRHLGEHSPFLDSGAGLSWPTYVAHAHKTRARGAVEHVRR